MATASQFWDIEGSLVAATVAALRERGIAATEMFAGDPKPGQRVEVRAEMIGETGREGLSATNQVIRIGYNLNLQLDVYTPIELPEEHSSLRGRIRGYMALPSGTAFINEFLPFAEVLEIVTGNSVNEAMTSPDGHDELYTTLVYQLHLNLLGGYSPTE